VSGYVRIYRSLIGHPAFRNDAEAMAFAWLVTKAAWKPVRVRYKERSIHLGRGQLAISQRDMARALDRDKAWIERLWKRLRAEAMIAVTVEAGVAVITICKYATYQDAKATREAAGEAREEAGARQGQGTEQGSEEEEEENTPQPPKGPRRGKTVLPEDWVLPTVAELPPQAQACARQWLPASYAAHGEEFISFWRSRGRMMKDWRLTWAGRVVDLHATVMRDQKFGNAPPAASSGKPMSEDEKREAAERFAASLDARGQHSEARDYRRQWSIPEPRQPTLAVIDNPRLTAASGRA
jgi:hypothetical protein